MKLSRYNGLTLKRRGVKSTYYIINRFNIFRLVDKNNQTLLTIIMFIITKSIITKLE